MKRRVLITMMAFTLTAAMLTGCGKPSQSQAAETIQESTEESTEETTEAAAEESNEVESSEEEIPTTEAYEESQEEESTEEITSSSEEKEEAPQETSKPATQPAAESSSVAPTDSTPTVPQPTVETSAVQSGTEEYNVTAMTATMYVKNSVNLRQGPGTSYAKVGSLNKGDQVTVTGVADNGWYQLDSGAFVSNKYLDNTAPATTVATAPGATVLPTDQTEDVNVLDMLNVSPYVANASEFFDYLNQQRSAAGLCTLTWDSDMATVAQRRAKELATDFSHNGNTERYNENIHTTNNLSSTYVDWYNSFYNSTAHRDTMMNPNIGRGSAALYFDGFNYYVICNFAGNPLSAEAQLEQLKPENLIPVGGNESGTVNSFSTTGETLEPDDPDYGWIYDLIEQEREQYN